MQSTIVATSGRRFLTVSFLTLAALCVIGIAVTPGGLPPSEVLANVLGYLRVVAVVWASAVAIAAVLCYVVFTYVLATPLSHLTSWFREQNNDSHAIVLAGLILISVIIALNSPGASLGEFLANVLSKGSFGLASGVVMTCFIARVLFGVKSMDQFKDWIHTPHNDSYALIVMATLFGSVLVFMGR